MGLRSRKVTDELDSCCPEMVQSLDPHCSLFVRRKRYRKLLPVVWVDRGWRPAEKLRQASFVREMSRDGLSEIRERLARKERARP